MSNLLFLWVNLKQINLDAQYIERTLLLSSYWREEIVALRGVKKC